MPSRPARSRRTAAPAGNPLGTMVQLCARGRIFDAEAAEKLIAASGLAPVEPLTPAGYENLAKWLDDATHTFVMHYRQEKAATAGERRDWMLRIEAACAELMALFGCHGAAERPSFDAVHTFTSQGPHDSTMSKHHRRIMAEDLGLADPPAEWNAALATLHGVGFLRDHARLGAARLVEKKGAAREKAWSEVAFIREIRGAFVNATGLSRRYTMDPMDNTPGGPFVLFAAAVAAHAVERLGLFDPDPARDAGMREALDALATTPARIVRRIRDARRYEPPRS